ncbi:MAG: YCF48-related protein [Rubrivivax sp.]
MTLLRTAVLAAAAAVLAVGALRAHAAAPGAPAAAASAPAAELGRITPRAVTAPTPSAQHALLLALARAGGRVVAVGERGTVLAGDARGDTLAQAASVPVDATLTAVHFVDAERGWAVGHWGAILATADGGRTWKQQRLDLAHDRPLFAVHFLDAQHGVAVGLWSLVLVTEDGGATWQERKLDVPPGAKKADLNLLGLFADAAGHLYATGERGLVLRSDDRGQTWRYLATGYRGSLWCGTALADGTLIVGGQRGSMWRSDDGGTRWTAVASGGKSSITSIAADGSRVAAVGLDGYAAFSDDGGRRFEARPREDRLTLTAVVADGNGAWLVASRNGWLRLRP